MASIYKRGSVWWIKFHLNGTRIQHSLCTDNKRVAVDKKRQIEYQLATGQLVRPSETPLVEFLEDYCQYLEGIRTKKSYKNDISNLRIFFGPVCPPLVPGNTCNASKQLRKKRPKIQNPLRGRHVRVALLEQVSSELVSKFITDRINKDGISAKTANRLREVLHRMFNYAIKEKGYRGPEGSRTNPVSDIQRRQEPAPTIEDSDLISLRVEHI